MSDRKVIDLMQTCDALESIEFYEINCSVKGVPRSNPNKGPELQCRIWNLEKLTDAEMVDLVYYLNEAIKPVTKRLAAERREKARSLLNQSTE